MFPYFAHLSESRKGETYVLSSALLWSLFPVFTRYTVLSLPPLFTAAIGTGISALFFVFSMTFRHQWRQLLVRSAWKDMLLTTLLIGSLYYAFIFVGIRHTTAGNASIMAMMEVFFSFLILGVLLKHEKIFAHHIAGALFMVIGVLFILLPKASAWQIGDLLVIIATIFAPTGNMYAKRAREKVGSECILLVRSALSSILLLLLAFFFEPLPSFQEIGSSFPLLFLNGFLILGFSKILWIEGAYRIPISKAISLASITPLFTLVFAYLILGEKVTLYQIIGFIPIVVGMYFLTKTQKKID